MRFALPLQLVQARTQRLHPVAQQAAVCLQLGFAGSAQADAALLTFQVGPAAHQPGGKMLQLGELDLYLALMALGALREDIEDQAGAVDHARLQVTFEVALLSGRQGMIEDDDIELLIFDGMCYFVGLARSDEKRSIRTGTFSRNGDDGIGSCRFGQQRQLFKTGGKITLAEIHADQGSAHGVFGLCNDIYSESDSRLMLTARAGTTVEMACLYTICVTVLRSSTTY